MEKRNLGPDGQQLSVLGLGCNNFGMKIDAAQTAAVVGTALDSGITHFDTAEMYGEGRSEEFLGAALQGRRDEAVIATKFLPRAADSDFRPGDLSRRIVEAAELSLKRLGTDRIDLYYQHYPDPHAPLDELLDAFDQLITAGKVIEVAISNVDATQIRETNDAAAMREDFPLRGVQIEWSLLSRDVEKEIVPAATESRLGVIPYFPLASGLLTGKYRGGAQPAGSRLVTMPYFAEVATEANLAKVDRLTDFAAERNRELIELAFGWLLAQKEVVSVIAGATSPEQVRTNAEAIDWKLSDEDLAEIDRILAGD